MRQSDAEKKAQRAYEREQAVTPWRATEAEPAGKPVSERRKSTR